MVPYNGYNDDSFRRWKREKEQKDTGHSIEVEILTRDSLRKKHDTVK